MKRLVTIYVILLISIVSCTDKNEKFLDVNKYIALEVEKIDYEGKTIEYASPKFVNNNDSISEIINKYPRRFRYILTNKINLETISEVMPDSVKARAMFRDEINSKKFKDYFCKTVYAQKEKFTEKELMKIASKFFFTEKYKNTFGVRTCIAINGLVKEDKKDFTLLEAVVFEAIFAELRKQNNEKPLFMQNLEKYRDTAIRQLDENVKDSLVFVRNLVFKSMENDNDLRNSLISYIKANNENVAVEIIK